MTATPQDSTGRQSAVVSTRIRCGIEQAHEATDVSDTSSTRREERRPSAFSNNEKQFTRTDYERLTTTEWITEPGICQRDDGVSKGLAGRMINRVAKLKALGNAVVPQIPEIIGMAILEVERGDEK